jgi:transposase InsO family protein
MPWRPVGVRDQRVEFAVRAGRGESISELCTEYGISRPTGYLWLRRFRELGVAGVEERNRRPLRSPRRTAAAIEARIVALRRERPDWGARKLAVLLEREGTKLPVLTVHRILLRHGLVLEHDRHRAATQRFERERPNELWQMDFKGPKEWKVPVGPLSVLDDHSRYLVALEQTGTTRGEAVRERLEGVFRSSGVPEAMLMDHGVPWWNTQAPSGWTRFLVWLMKQGIGCHFSGFRHPQTQGKVERFHGALERARDRRTGPHPWLAQSWLDEFRQEYNQVRPHEALGMRTPASVWQPSPRKYDPNPSAWEYGAGADVRPISVDGDLYLDGRRWPVSLALASEKVELKRLDQRLLIYFCRTLVRDIDLAAHRSYTVDRWARLPTCKESPDNEL